MQIYGLLHSVVIFLSVFNYINFKNKPVGQFFRFSLDFGF